METDYESFKGFYKKDQYSYFSLVVVKRLGYDFVFDDFKIKKHNKSGKYYAEVHYVYCNSWIKSKFNHWFDQEEGFSDLFNALNNIGKD